MARRDLCVTIVGAGIGGLVTALSLYEVGADVDVHESVRELRPLGVGINLLPHAVRELDALGLLERLRRHAVEPTSLVYCSRHGQEIWREPRGTAAGYPWPQLSIHRGLLQEVLLDAFVERVGAEHLHLGHRLARVDADDESARATFELAGGEGDDARGSVETTADAVVAADGIHSVARAQRYPEEGRPCWNGALLWRGVADIDPVLDGRSMVWAGHRDQKFVGYPIADLPDGRQAFNFIAELRRPGSPLGSGEDWNRSGELDDFLPEFEAWVFDWLDVPAIVRAAPGTFLFPMVDRDPVARWTYGRSTLLGDAAHPMYPIGSNGASQAILDARVLAGCVRADVDVRAALERFERLRLPTTGAIVEANRGLGPEVPMQLVHERAPDGFADIGSVITRDEIDEVTEAYRRTAGFALSALRADPRSLVDQTADVNGSLGGTEPRHR
jgi:2-polyprenyl-6-methoxyphenol hydroxylase-like FAD-dependent oxidoreductase